MSARLSVSWGAYQKNICNGFSFLQQRGEFVDMTLAADGHHVQVHKMVLCLVSPYIKELVAATQCAHPVIFLNNVSSATLEHILEYAYTGEALVPRDKIKEFLQACKSLHIKGLEHTSTIELHKESQESMSQEMRATEPVEDNDVVDTEFDDRGHDDNEILFDNNDQTTETADDTIIKSTTLTPKNKPQSLNTSSSNKTAGTASNILSLVPGNEKETRVQYTISNHGHLQIILNRYMYCFNYKRIKTNEMVWRCLLNKKKCPATVSTRDGKVVHRSKAHNHTFADKAILKRLQQGLVYSELSEAQHMLKADKNFTANTSSDITHMNLDDNYDE